MCGIAGLIHKGKSSSVGFEMTQMLQALKHRGPDSTGYAVYGNEVNDLVMRLKIAEAEDMQRGSGIYAELDRRINQVDSFIDEHGVKVTKKDKINDYSYRYEFSFNGDLGKLAEHIEEVNGAEILSVGKGLELIKDLGDASDVSNAYGLKVASKYKIKTHILDSKNLATENFESLLDFQRDDDAHDDLLLFSLLLF